MQSEPALAVAHARWTSAAVGAALVLGAFAYLMAYPPALDGADESYILYEAKRLWEGDAPYRDFFDFIMPGTFYFYALAYAVAGPTITAARGATALLNAASCGLMFVLARRVASPAPAALAAAAFVAGIVPAWNHAGHHWIATFLSLATAAVVLAQRWRESSRARPALAGGLAAALVCSHQGRGSWVVLWLAIVVPLLAWARSQSRWGRRVLQESCWTGLGALAVAVPMLGWAVWRASLHEVVYATYTFVVESYARVNVGKMLWGGSLNFYGVDPDPMTWPWLLRAIPALLGIEALALGGTILSEGLRRHVVRASLFLLAVCTACSVFYFPDYIHVATIAPFSLIVVAGLAHRLGAASAALRRPVLTAAWRLGCALVAAAVVMKGARNITVMWERNAVLVPSAFGTLALSERSASVLRDLQHEFPSGRDGRPRLFGYPSDAWVYLATPADDPTPFCLLQTGYNTPEQFDTAIARLRADPNAFVLVRWLLLSRADPIMELLKREYEVVRGIGPTSGPFALHGLVLYARRDRSSSPQRE
jgi:hypothetical protein